MERGKILLSSQGLDRSKKLQEEIKKDTNLSDKEIMKKLSCGSGGTIDAGYEQNKAIFGGNRKNMGRTIPGLSIWTID
jgi:hypothetical protein